MSAAWGCHRSGEKPFHPAAEGIKSAVSFIKREYAIGQYLQYSPVIGKYYVGYGHLVK